jgi:hypothetical protein
MLMYRITRCEYYPIIIFIRRVIENFKTIAFAWTGEDEKKVVAQDFHRKYPLNNFSSEVLSGELDASC